MVRKLKLSLLIQSIIIVSAIAQSSGQYSFNGNFNSDDGQLPALTPLNGTGRFITDKLPELGNIEKTVYAFNKNEGLRFDNTKAKDFFKDSYSIEMYFRFDELNSWKRVIDWKNRSMDNGAYIFDGRLNFYNIAKSDIAPVRINEYTHYIITRDANTKKVRIYADGIGKIEFIDSDNLATIGKANYLQFFRDDKKVDNEASAGAVAYIKLYDYTIDQAEAKETFSRIEETISSSNAVTDASQIESPILITEVSFYTVTISDKKTNEPLNSHLKMNGVELKNPNGVFKVQKGNNIALQAHATGYFPKDTLVSMNKDVIIKLAKAEVGAILRLENINFVRSQSVILEESQSSLEQLLGFMQENPSIKIELGGHTDNTGSARLNQELSEKRALTVKEYLIENGISKSRIKHKGYGPYKPLVPNNTESSRKMNRRVECKIISD